MTVRKLKYPTPNQSFMIKLLETELENHNKVEFPIKSKNTLTNIVKFCENIPLISNKFSELFSELQVNNNNDYVISTKYVSEFLIKNIFNISSNDFMMFFNINRQIKKINNKMVEVYIINGDFVKSLLILLNKLEKPMSEKIERVKNQKLGLEIDKILNRDWYETTSVRRKEKFLAGGIAKGLAW